MNPLNPKLLTVLKTLDSGPLQYGSQFLFIIILLFFGEGGWGGGSVNFPLEYEIFLESLIKFCKQIFNMPLPNNIIFYFVF